MNYLDAETQAELNRKRIIEEIHQIRMAEDATRGRNILQKTLAAIGAWLVVYGENLRRKNSTHQTRYVEFHNKIAQR